MNAISLLSGWSPGNSHAGSSTQQSGAAAAVLDGDHEDGHPLRPLTTGNGQDIGLARGTSSPSTRVFTDNDGQLGARMESASTLEATSAIIEQSPHSESLYDGLLLSEREYESREREAAAAAYPSPPPTPNPDDDGMSVQRAQDKQDSLPSSTYPSAPLILGTRPRAPGDLQHLDALSPDPANKEKYPSDTKHALLQASSDLIARSLPVRCLVRLYTLLRRFFAVFGLRLHTRPVSSRQSLGASHNNNSALTSLSHALLANGMAESPSHPNPPIEQPERPSRWRPRFVGFERRRKPHSPTVAANSEPRESEKGQLYTEKGGSANEVGQRPLAVQSSQSKRTSLAQLAVSRPKTLVLDLDETLIHSTSRLGPGLNNLVTSVDGGRTNYKADVSSLKVRVVEVVLDGRSVVYHVYKRPWVDFFLRKVSWMEGMGLTCMMTNTVDSGIEMVYCHYIYSFYARVCGSGHRLAGPWARHLSLASVSRVVHVHEWLVRQGFEHHRQ